MTIDMLKCGRRSVYVLNVRPLFPVRIPWISSSNEHLLLCSKYLDVFSFARGGKPSVFIRHENDSEYASSEMCVFSVDNCLYE